MVHKSQPGHRLCLRYVLAILIGLLLIYGFWRTVSKQDIPVPDHLRQDWTIRPTAGATTEQPHGEETPKPPKATPHSPEPFISPSSDKASLHVVIAHYEEDPYYIRTWLDSLRSVPYVQQLGLHVTIYTKGSLDPVRIKETTAAQEVVQLPNTGREGGTYLHHILKHYDDHPPFTLFSQAYLRKAQIEGSGEEAGHLQEWLVERLSTKFDNKTGFMSLDRKHDICYCGHCSDMKVDRKAFYPLWPQLYTLITGQVCQEAAGDIMSFNGHFIVSRRRIMARPRHIYEYLEELVEAPEDHWIHKQRDPAWFDKAKAQGKSRPSNPKFGHTLERLWHTLFACDRADVVEDCDIEGMKAEGKGGCMCRDTEL